MIIYIFTFSAIKFLANNLTLLEILQQFNTHISSKVKAEDTDINKPLEIKKLKKIKQIKK